MLPSLVSLLVLAWLNPKRRRDRRADTTDTGLLRTLSAGLLMAPGVWLIYNAQWSLVLLWIGAVSVAGWLITYVASFVSRSVDAPNG